MMTDDGLGAKARKIITRIIQDVLASKRGVDGSIIELEFRDSEWATLITDLAESHFASELADHVRLRNLLAVIHRDGGHYVAEFGIEQASADAEILVVGLRARAEQAERERDAWSELAGRREDERNQAEAALQAVREILLREYRVRNIVGEDIRAHVAAELAARDAEIARLKREVAEGFTVSVADVTNDAATLAELGRAKEVLARVRQQAIEKDNGYFRCLLCGPREHGAHTPDEVFHRKDCAIRAGHQAEGRG
jgi:hypothetical protein